MRVTVVGAGSWGTALAHLAASGGHQCILWGRNAEVLREIGRTRHNPRYLTDLQLDYSLLVEEDLARALREADVVVMAVPAQAFAGVLQTVAPQLGQQAILLSSVKGLDAKRRVRMGEIVQGIVKNIPYAVLTGPNLAAEIAQGVPAASVVFSASGIAAATCQQIFHSSRFRVYTGNDVIGAELAGALKNVYAIAAGASDAMGFGWNSKAAFLTRALAEMVRLGVPQGAKAETYYGLAGVGDLFATAASSLSRNYRVGFGLAQGKPLDVVLAELGQVSEGVPTTQAALEMAREARIEAPLLESISSVLFSGVPPREALADLMRRVAGAEMKPA